MSDTTMSAIEPTRSVIDMNVGDRQTVVLSDGTVADIAVLGIEATCDSVRGAVRSARVHVAANGESVWVSMAGYCLPRSVGGIQVDCAVVGMLTNKRENVWQLDHDVRLRLWPGGSPWIRPGTMRYPARQRWFATDTQMCNEPCFVGGAEYVGTDRVYYHDGLDIGGSEGQTELIASADGMLLAVGDDVHPRAEAYEMQPRYDRVFILDVRDWVHIYSHVKVIEPSLRPGMCVKMGDPIGLLGKEGSSGGWSHLHYGIKTRQPSGELASEEGYAFLWQTYVDEYNPAVVAVARPHTFVRRGEYVLLDGSRSWAADPRGIVSCEWRFCDGTTDVGSRVERCYETPGIYSEILTVRDGEGNEAVDFAVVQVVDVYGKGAFPPGIHAAYYPTLDLRPGTPITFKVRSFHVEPGDEIWNFGDGTPLVLVRSVPYGFKPDDKHAPDGYAEVEHAYAEVGRYIATVIRIGPNGLTATARVCVEVRNSGR